MVVDVNDRRLRFYFSKLSKKPSRTLWVQRRFQGYNFKLTACIANGFRIIEINVMLNKLTVKFLQMKPS